jgi:hypothetical protein
MTIIEPTYAWWSHAATTGQLTNIAVYNSELQSDGKLSLLALTHDSTNSLLKWGMLQDQTFTDGATYSIDLIQDPIVTGWSTLPSRLITSLDIIGLRKGVSYTLYGTPFNFTPVASASIAFPTEFPVESYWLWADADVTSVMNLSTGKSYNTLPQTIEIPMADFNFSVVDYSATNRVLSWTLVGSSARDILDINLTGVNNLEQPVTWSIVMSPTRNSWQVMDLPPPADTWINTADLAASIYEATIEVVDLDFLSGADDTWSFFITGGDIEAAASQVLAGEYNFSTGVAGVLTAAKAATVSKVVAPPTENRSISDRLSGKLSGLRRR